MKIKVTFYIQVFSKAGQDGVEIMLFDNNILKKELFLKYLVKKLIQNHFKIINNLSKSKKLVYT